MARKIHNALMTPVRHHRRLHYFFRNLFFTPAEKARAKNAVKMRMARTLPIVMIVGCPRSGTSFTARMLNSAGLTLPGEHTPPDAFNPNGYFEEDRVVGINSDILWGSSGHWLTPPAKLRVYSYQRTQIVQAFAWLCGFEAVCGWKDPRGTLTLPVWLEVARKLDIPIRVVGVFRNPLAAANSIVQHERGKVDFAQALNAWCLHNIRLLELAAGMPDRFYWFTIDQDEQAVEQNLNAIAIKLELAGRVSLDRAKKSASEKRGLTDVSESAQNIYQRLIVAHAAQWGDAIKQTIDCEHA